MKSRILRVPKTSGRKPDGVAYFVDQKPRQADFLAEVIAGLSITPRSIGPKFFYDETGSHLFNKICETPEYYITRTELALLNKKGPEISVLSGKNNLVIEYGCGSSLKINSLLNALDEPSEYLAIDISKESLCQTTEEVVDNYPDVRVGALCVDFLEQHALPNEVGEFGGSRLAFFPGSTIGNQTPKEATSFLRKVHDVVGKGGAMLIGVDLEKEIGMLESAYNDRQGYTAAFNLNLIHRMKNELEAEIDIGSFDHLAFFNEQESRIEMHLVSNQAQTVALGGKIFRFNKGETIHTENSYKYSISEFSSLASESGFTVKSFWTDKNNLFSLQYLIAT